MNSFNLDQLQQALDTYGSQLDTWPTALAAAATQLVQSSAQARQLLAQAEQLDGALQAALPPLPDDELPALKRLILTKVQALAPDNSLLPRFWQWLCSGYGLRPALLATLPLALGFALGLSLTEPDMADGELFAELTLLAFTEPFEGYANGQ